MSPAQPTTTTPADPGEVFYNEITSYVALPTASTESNLSANYFTPASSTTSPTYPRGAVLVVNDEYLEALPSHSTLSPPTGSETGQYHAQDGTANYWVPA